MFFGGETLMCTRFYTLWMRAVYRCNHADELYTLYIPGYCTLRSVQNQGDAF